MNGVPLTDPASSAGKRVDIRFRVRAIAELATGNAMFTQPVATSRGAPLRLGLPFCCAPLPFRVMRDKHSNPDESVEPESRPEH
jgi:hypothetical protein